MNHVRTRELLGDHLEGDLDPALRSEVARHVDACEECAQELRELRETVALLRGLPEPEPPARLSASVMARLAAGEGRPPWHARLPRLLSAQSPLTVAAAAGVAGFAILLGLGDFLGARSSGPELTSFPAPNVPGAVTEASVAVDMPTVGGGRGPRDSFRSTAVSTASLPTLRPPRMDSRDLRAQFLGVAAFEPRLRRLDGDLAQLMNDPAPMLDRLSRFSDGQREAELAPLVARSVTRHQALDVAHRLRKTQHPLAPAVAERFEGASLR